jgi:hypothetical protein
VIIHDELKFNLLTLLYSTFSTKTKKTISSDTNSENESSTETITPTVQTMTRVAKNESTIPQASDGVQRSTRAIKKSRWHKDFVMP